MFAAANIDTFLVIFPSIVFEALPFVIIGALISGALEEFLPQRLITRILPRRRSLAIAGSAVLGLVFPMCDCGVVPVMRRLLSKGLPLSCACAYMLGAPLLNPVVLIATWAAFSGDRRQLDELTSFQMVTLRAGIGFITAMILGLIIERQVRLHGAEALIQPLKHKKHQNPDLAHKHVHAHQPAESAASNGNHDQCGHDHDCADHDHEHEELSPAKVHDLEAEPEEQKRSLRERLTSISETTLHDFTDISTYLIIGSCLAAAVQTFELMKYVGAVGNHPAFQTVAMMLLAIVICLCSEADAFVAANLIDIGLAGKLSFLVLSPMFDLKLYMMYTRVFKKRLIVTIVVSLLVTIFTLSMLTQYLDEAALGRRRGKTSTATAATPAQTSAHSTERANP